MFITYYLHKVYFSCQNPNFCGGKVWPGFWSGSAWISIGWLPGSGSGSAFQPMWIWIVEYIIGISWSLFFAVVLVGCRPPPPTQLIQQQWLPLPSLVLCLLCAKSYQSNTVHYSIVQSTVLLPVLSFVLQNQKPNSWTYNFAEVSGHNLRVLRLEVSVYNFYTTDQFSNHFFSMGWGGVKIC